MTSWWDKKEKITFLFGSRNWMQPYFDNVIAELSKTYQVSVIEKHEDMEEGDIAFFLGYPRIIPTEYLGQHKSNYVVHASDLPKGRGMSPWVWDVLNGADYLHVCLMQAVEALDEGRIIYKEKINLGGHELINDLRDLIADKATEMVSRFLKSDNFIEGVEQVGEPTYHSRRRPKDSELDLNKTIEAQFNLLRVVDNDAYPAFFIRNGVQYTLKIEKISEE